MMEAKRKFYIERWRDGTWVRIPGATATSLKDAEGLKLTIAKVAGENVKNFTMVCEVKDWD